MSDRSPRPLRAHRAFSRVALFALVPLLLAIALRWPWFGDPVAGLDEQFYLLVGDRLLSGLLPYVDIWDRKPAGLFLIYAAIRLLPGDGIMAYQIVGIACLAATGSVAAAIARRFAPTLPALAAGCIVVVYGVVLGPGFGEPPIFHDLLTVTAVWLVLSGGSAGPTFARAALAMLACGVAITIKTSAVFEGVAIGAALAWLEWRRDAGAARFLRRMAAYAAAGALPTLAIACCYAAIGEFGRFWFANVLSIFRKAGGASSDSTAGLIACALVMAPLIGFALLGVRQVTGSARILLLCWTGGCVASFVAIGFFSFHYALPLVTPLAILAAPALARWGGGLVLAGAGLLAGNALATASPAPRDRAEIAALVRMIPPAVRRQCLMVYEGPTTLYHLTGACLPGRYVFPGHFTDPGEARALERSSAAIVQDMLRRRPAAIVTVAGQASPNGRFVAAALARGYVRAGSGPVRLYGAQRVTAEVWVRR